MGKRGKQSEISEGNELNKMKRRVTFSGRVTLTAESEH